MYCIRRVQKATERTEGEVERNFGKQERRDANVVRNRPRQKKGDCGPGSDRLIPNVYGADAFSRRSLYMRDSFPNLSACPLFT